MNKQILIVGVALLLGGFIFQAILNGTSGYETDPTDGLFGLAMFVGLILIVVGAIKSPHGTVGQQQQQQVVVYTGAPGDAAPAEPRLILRCPTCQTLNEASARYCMDCGHAIPAPTPGASGRRVSKPVGKPRQ